MQREPITYPAQFNDLSPMEVVGPQRDVYAILPPGQDVWSQFVDQPAFGRWKYHGQFDVAKNPDYGLGKLLAGIGLESWSTASNEELATTHELLKIKAEVEKKEKKQQQKAAQKRSGGLRR